ncbi:DUF7314 family protein [Haloparvum sedimenti]|uniref:DUF7314 family protein n=1 Tax=Haloparvum sedimenti TaxID=1678448 RepID=UPI00071E7AEE|nr:hypothetical protein [Haloparvum sedimenti]
MADEFMKGFAISMVGALGWFFFAGWYRTPSFEQIQQLTVEPPEPNGIYDAVAIFASDLFFWLMVLGPLTFWVIIPALRELRRSRADASN